MANRRDDCCGTCAEYFGQLACIIGICDLLNGDTALRNRNALGAAQLQSRLSGDTGQNGAGFQRRCYHFAVNDESDVHGTNLFDVLLFYAIQPQNLRIALLISISLTVQRSRIVTAGLGITHTAADSTNILVFYVDIDRIQTGSIVRAGRRENDHKQIVFARMYAEERIYCKNKRTNVQGSTFCVRNPILFHRDEFFQTLETQLLRQFRNDQTLVGTVQTLEVFVRTEQLYAAVGTAVCLQTFEYFLTILHNTRAFIQNNIRRI